MNSDLISRLSPMAQEKAALQDQLAIAQARVPVCSSDTTPAPPKSLLIGSPSLET